MAIKYGDVLEENLISIRIIGLILLLSIFLQIILGAWVRLTGSGMSCPDWPLCYGYIFPTPNKIANIPNVEYSYFQIFLEFLKKIDLLHSYYFFRGFTRCLQGKNGF